MIMAITAYSTVGLGRIPQVTRVCMSVVVFCVIVFTRVKCYMWFMTLTCVYLNHQPISAVGLYLVAIIRLINFLSLKPAFLFWVSAVGGGNLQ